MVRESLKIDMVENGQIEVAQPRPLGQHAQLNALVEGCRLPVNRNKERGFDYNSSSSESFDRTWMSGLKHKVLFIF